MIYVAYKKGVVYAEKNGFFQQENPAIHNASITKKYMFEEKIRLLDHRTYSPDSNHIENLWGLIVAKIYEGGRQYSAISELKKAIIHTWEKYLRFNFRNLLIVCIVIFLGYQSDRRIYKILNKNLAFIFYCSARWSYIYVKTKF